MGGKGKSLAMPVHRGRKSYRKSILNIHWKDWCWSWSSNSLATWCKELTHWKRPWCWERLKAGGEGDDRGQDGWMASLTRWTWVWASSGSWWWTGKPGMLQSGMLQSTWNAAQWGAAKSQTQLSDWTVHRGHLKLWHLMRLSRKDTIGGKRAQDLALR